MNLKSLDLDGHGVPSLRTLHTHLGGPCNQSWLVPNRPHRLAPTNVNPTYKHLELKLSGFLQSV